MTMAELAAPTAAVVGPPMRFEDESVEDAYQWRRTQFDAEPWKSTAGPHLHLDRRRSMSEVTDDVRRSGSTSP